MAARLSWTNAGFTQTSMACRRSSHVKRDMASRERTGKEQRVEHLPAADRPDERRVVHGHEGGFLSCKLRFQALHHAIGTIGHARQRRRHRLDGRGRRDQHAVRGQKRQHTGGLARLESDHQVGGAVRQKWREHFFSTIAHAHVRGHVAAALRHADGLGRAHLPPFVLRRLRQHLRRQHRALAAHSRQQHVKHGSLLPTAIRSRPREHPQARSQQRERPRVRAHPRVRGQAQQRGRP